jgi:hypothetical protein
VIVLLAVNIWLSNQFNINELGEASYILGIKLWGDHKNRTLDISPAAYIHKIMSKCSM